MKNIPAQEINNVIDSLNGREFTTYDFIESLKKIHPATWKALEKEYGKGGVGAGQPHTVNHHIAQILNNLYKSNVISKLKPELAPKNWGNKTICKWGVSTQKYPDEIQQSNIVIEGAKLKVVVNKYERDPTARGKCIEKWGVDCSVCAFNFKKRYGELGTDYIHVHHLKPLSEIAKEYKLDPVNDLRPVCPNCHAMLHSKVPAISIEELKKLIQTNVVLTREGDTS